MIGGVKRHSGYIEANGYTVTWAVGHLVTLADAHEYDAKYKTWRLSDLPIVPKPFRLKVIHANKNQYQVVASLLKQAEEVIVATDAGREGQLIYEFIALSVGYKGRARRLWLSSMTEEAIRTAMGRLKDNIEYKNLYHAGFARAQADWLTGINATRAITVHAGTLLTIGRVQTPTLAMIVERDVQIEQFKPEPYFEIESLFEHENGTYTGKWFNGDKTARFEDKANAEQVIAKVAGQPAHISKLEQKTIKEQPPQLFDLTTLQRTANQKYGLTADETLKLAQSLYETHKVLTYPRTDSRYLPDDVVPTLPKRLQAASKTFPELVTLLPKRIQPSKRVVDASKVSDHHAILPTEKAVSTTLRSDERKIYELVVKQTIAALLKPAEWATTTMETTVVGELFKTTGRVLLKSGWRAVFSHSNTDGDNTKSNEEDSHISLPAVAKGDKVETKRVDLLAKQTKPPSHFTEATLLAAMENAGKQVVDETLAEALKERGLGTPATRASVIEKIKRDDYVRTQKRNLISTEKGRTLIGFIHVDVLKSPELTGEWEHRLGQIESGQYSVSHFMEEIVAFTQSVVESIKQTEVDMPLSMQALPSSQDIIGVCPLCGGDVIETKKSFGCTNWKTSGCKFTVWKQISGHNVTKAQAKELLAKKKTRLLKFKTKAGKVFQAHLIVGTNGRIEFEFAKRTSSSGETGTGHPPD